MHLALRRRIIASIVAIAFAVAATLLGLSWRNSAIETSLTWARVAPIPESAHDRHVTTKGNMFTREYIITFTAPPNNVRQWLMASPGPSSAKQSLDGAITVYAISPGGGAQFAE